ncbi:PilN domain-containing protein [Aestuariicella hydrocarbonica]|uniref:PilN domain-containing protein n=1 Tax=Pseudomaricurvus hydrocarbonicus TaxID=1470433 RepID=A0A9E5JWF6_9GAMM|nr:PilN domain-containing protein [Aestuariicella hydrocarbonica]NHO65775.1 PilN domain-containing protein [Aestuariicella hydrocarbonica]
MPDDHFAQTTGSSTFSLDILLRQLQTGWQWWLSQLQQMLPANATTWFHANQPRLLIEFERGQLTCRFQRTVQDKTKDSSSLKADRQIFTLNTDEVTAAQLDDIRSKLAEAVSDSRTHGITSVVCLAANQALVKTLRLPLATVDNLRDVLGFEMDRFTPFRSEQVYYDYCITSREPVKQTLTLQLAVIPRATLAPVFAVLDQLNLHPDQVGLRCNSIEQVEFNFITDRSEKMKKDSRYRWRLAGIAMLLLSAIIVLPLWHLHQLSADLRAEIDGVKQEALDASALLRIQQTLEQQLRDVITIKNQQVAIVDILRELTSIVPMDTWITRLEFNRDQLKLHGESGNASKLIEILDNSPLFTDVSFYSPVTSNPRTGKQRFVITVAEVKVTLTSTEGGRAIE